MDPIAQAASAGLTYVSDELPGLRRRRAGKGFAYHDTRGRLVRDPGVKERIASLAIPPAWTDVWICPDPDGHLQATGRDAKGRKQYRYHPTWREARDAEKFLRLGEFAARLPDLRRAVAADLRRPGLPDVRVLALLVRLLDDTLVRIGNAEYAADNESFGLTTLRTDHVEVTGRRARFEFDGKGGLRHEVAVTDPLLVHLVQECEGLDGDELFAYLDDDGQVVDVDSTDVNEYIRAIAGEQFSAKDFRTWGGTVVCAEQLSGCTPTGNERDDDSLVVSAVETAAEMLRNTRAVARASYVHPTVIDLWRAGVLREHWRAARASRWLSRCEVAVRRALRDATGAAAAA
ncbi:MAG TPA: DNA topoisomerase IB [Acidimicrobiia bacterium]|nr:DNA topoisomerase IB [Acidimicrobiia bacterium]